ncbi:hypothetical protein MRS44_014227 [Fusarium solani]|uniref:uncharacterized protein n=1 Tax=Fusarium solani TaxID=169388 RepID=UPI0032C48329|nr:hypothetical protein MRS44_014227 [Fusarium solani]
MDDEESLSHQLAIKLLIEELEVDDALKEKRRQRASGEVLAGRLAPEESTALPSGTSTNTDRLRDLYQDALGPSLVGQPSQETAGEKGPVVDAAGHAPKPSPAPVTGSDDREEDDDDLYRDDGVTINRQPKASPAPAVAPVPAPVTEEDSDLYRDDGKALDRKPKPSIARLADIYDNLSRDERLIFYRQRTLKNIPRDKKPFKILGLAEVHHIAAEARRRDPLSNLPVEANDRRRTVCSLTQVVDTPARRSQPVVIHEDNDEEDLISFENTVTFRPGTQPEDSSIRSMASDSRLSETSSLQAQQSRPLRPQPSSSRFGPFANPRPEDNVRPRGASAETDPDKENVYCHSCGNDCEESVVLCPCGHYYCPQCLGQIVESSVGGDSSPFPPLCCGKPVPVDVNSTIFDKDVLKAFMEKKLGLPLSERATRAARTLPPAAKVGP